MKFTKAQVRTILTLNGVTVILFVTMFFLPWVNPAFADKTEPPETEVPVIVLPHDPYRAPRPAADAKLAWEMNLGGSGTDSVLSAYETASGILIFGNTESTDYDFANQEKGCFVLLLGFNGKVINYAAYAGELKKTIALDDGFLLCVNSEIACDLIQTDALGIEIHRINLKSAPEDLLLDVYRDYFSAPDTEPYHAVVEYTNPNTGYKELRIHVLSYKLEERYKRWFTRAQSLNYIAGYSHRNGFYLFSNLTGYNTSTLTYYNWRKNSSSENDFDNLAMPLIPKYTCDSIIPVDVGRYAALIRTEDNVPYLVDCYQDFKRHALHDLGTVPAEKTLLIADAELYYAYVYRTGDISAMYRFDQNLSVRDEVAGLKKLTGLYCHTVTTRGTLFCGSTVNGIIVAGINQNGVSFESTFSSQNETIRIVVETTDGLILIGESSAKGLNVGNNFGGTDIWVTKLLF